MKINSNFSIMIDFSVFFRDLWIELVCYGDILEIVLDLDYFIVSFIILGEDKFEDVYVLRSFIEDDM